MARVTLTVELGLEGARLDPDAVARDLGVPAQQVGYAGEVRPGGRVRPASFCLWSIGPEATYEWEPLLVCLLDQLRPLERVREAAAAYGAEIFVSVVAHVYGDLFPERNAFESSAPAHHLTAPILAELATLGASLDIDEYIQIDERPDDERPDDERSTNWYSADP